MIAKKFLIENGYKQTKILVVYPPAVEENWKKTFKDFGIDKYAKFISNGSLHYILDAKNYNYWTAEEYDLVLVDEAHKFRSNDTQAFEFLQKICKMPRKAPGNIPGSKKKVMLISATPLNNSPEDLYTQIQLFQDPRNCTIDGVPNLITFFNPLIKQFERLRKSQDLDNLHTQKMVEKLRNRLIKPLTIRRTRTDIESIPRYAKEINGFPKVERPIESRYELNESLAKLFEQAVQTLDQDLHYAYYKIIENLKPEVSIVYYENPERISQSLAGIRKNGLIKRLESSFYAFKVSINKLRQANQNMMNMFDNDKVMIAPKQDLNKMLSTMTEIEIEEYLNKQNRKEQNIKVFNRDDFNPEFYNLLKDDQKLLEQICKDWEEISDEDDSKFAKFEELLKSDFFKKDRNPGQKLVVFSESVDTINYLQRRINRSDVLVVSSENRKELFQTILENFDANYKTKLNDYNVILTTDVLSEGINLHRASVIVNYDTPWNSIRLMQRIGRVNRIGSISKIIYNYVFYPSREGNRELKLSEIAVNKIQSFHSIYGEDNQIYSQSEILDRNIGKLFEEALELEKEELNHELPYYEELRSLYQNNRKEYNRIAKLSLRSRTGRKSRIIEEESLTGKTLVFLKTNFRMLFYLVSEEVKDISVLEALNYFKASHEEQPVTRIEEHHLHVERAQEKFKAIRRVEIVQEEKPNGKKENDMGVRLMDAIRLLNSFIPQIKEEHKREKVLQLKELIERGVLSTPGKEVYDIKKALTGKNRKEHLTQEGALTKILKLAKKYESYYMENEVALNETETEAQIILSESFQ